MEQGQVYGEDVEPGQEIPEVVKRVTPRQLVMWAAASGDFYEIHYDADYARSVGLPGIVVHGALKHAFLGDLLHRWVAPGGRVVSFGCSYRELDRPGELRCRGRVRGVRREGTEHLVELEVWVEDAQGRVTTPGSAVVALPSRSGAEA
ncbi:MAG TPA: MaoC/PaaZ C-terminal domain-containing protein [Actinomycetota bacterium]|nr:MaoC/PaaZ C-terminal domain-containing protein [Actinomycetota bacterium]